MEFVTKVIPSSPKVTQARAPSLVLYYKKRLKICREFLISHTSLRTIWHVLEVGRETMLRTFPKES